MSRLTISRRSGQRARLTLQSGEEIWLTVNKTSHGHVDLVIEAPRSVRIEREEIILPAICESRA